ncbi:MAG: prepilin-type N-terminal cleavage/methylation domain-containing protein [Planctomycetes bacterium]|nr:prepilin-type N-terminal cleavage/methylation domain-containing protein [Planctomycetota bacterium]
MRRRAFSLIELTVVLTVLSLVWLIVTSVIYTLYRADHRLRDDLQHEQALDSFVMRLRLDTHEARAAVLAPIAAGGTELVLSTADDKSIHYGVSEEGIYRVVQQADAVVHRDTFVIGRATGVWKLLPEETSSLVALTLTSRHGRSQTNRVRHIKAAVATAGVTLQESAEASS